MNKRQRKKTDKKLSNSILVLTKKFHKMSFKQRKIFRAALKSHVGKFTANFILEEIASQSITNNNISYELTLNYNRGDV